MFYTVNFVTKRLVIIIIIIIIIIIMHKSTTSPDPVTAFPIAFSVKFGVQDTDKLSNRCAAGVVKSVEAGYSLYSLY